MVKGIKVDLVAVEESDLPQLLRYRQDLDISQWFYEKDEISLDQQILWYKNIQENKTKKIWAIKEKGTKRTIGIIGLSDIDYRSRKAEFGSFFIYPDPACIRKGYGRESLILVLDYAFSHMNLHKLYCTTFEFNTVALKLYISLGFETVGIHKNHIYRDGKYENIMILEKHKI